MKHCFNFIFAFISLFTAFSCSKDNDVTDYDALWKAANEKAFNDIKSNSEYKELKSPGNEGSIYYKVLNKGEGTDSIYYTSSVKVYYSGKFTAEDTRYGIKSGSYFERKTIDYSTPVTFTVNNNIGGWKTALPNMVKGDKWEVYIPFQLGYGSSGKYDSNSGMLVIPPYATLLFEIEVLDIVK